MAFTQGNLSCWEFFKAFDENLERLDLGSADEYMNKTLLIGALRNDIVDAMRQDLKGAKLDGLSYEEIQSRAKAAEKRLKATDSYHHEHGPQQSLAFQANDGAVRRAWAEAYNLCKICLMPSEQGSHGKQAGCQYARIAPEYFRHIREEYRSTGTIKPPQSGRIDDVMAAVLPGDGDGPKQRSR